MNRPVIDDAMLAKIMRDARATRNDTDHLLASPRNARRRRRAIADMDRIPRESHDDAPRASDGAWLLWGLGGALLWLAGLAYLGAL